MSIIPNYVPNGYKSVNVLMVVKDAISALEFYNQAFGAETIILLKDPQGRVMYAEFKITDTIIMLTEENSNLNSAPSTLGGSSVVIYLYTGDAEALFEHAVKAGAEVLSPIEEQFFGDRSGRIQDPFGHQWIIATHMEDFSAHEIHQRFNQLYS
jgi:PhnB protein